MNAPPGQPPGGGPGQPKYDPQTGQPIQQAPQPQQPAFQPQQGYPVQQGYQQPGYYQPQQAPMPPVQKKPDETLALVSLILAIASWIMGLFILGSLPAVICGHMAKKKIKAEPERYGGDSMATAGLVVGYINLAFFIIMALLVIASIVLPFCAACGFGLLGAAAG